MTRHKSPTVSPGVIVREMTAAEIGEAAARWVQCFGANSAGVNTRDFLWHVFSSKRFPSLSGEAALQEYGAQLASEYIVLSGDCDEGFITDLRPTSSSLFDWLVFPPNLAWTMAFTHEDGWLGPYFARSVSYSRLNDENLSKVRKANEAARAKAKGWC